MRPFCFAIPDPKWHFVTENYNWNCDLIAYFAGPGPVMVTISDNYCSTIRRPLMRPGRYSGSEQALGLIKECSWVISVHLARNWFHVKRERNPNGGRIGRTRMPLPSPPEHKTAIDAMQSNNPLGKKLRQSTRNFLWYGQFYVIRTSGSCECFGPLKAIVAST